jgi:hypothetical protein
VSGFFLSFLNCVALLAHRVCFSCAYVHRHVRRVFTSIVGPSDARNVKVVRLAMYLLWHSRSGWRQRIQFNQAAAAASTSASNLASDTPATPTLQSAALGASNPNSVQASQLIQELVECDKLAVQIMAELCTAWTPSVIFGAEAAAIVGRHDMVAHRGWCRCMHERMTGMCVCVCVSRECECKSESEKA